MQELFIALKNKWGILKYFFLTDAIILVSFTQNKFLFITLFILTASIGCYFIALGGSITEFRPSLTVLRNTDLDHILNHNKPNEKLILPFLLGLDNKKKAIFYDLITAKHVLITGKSGKGKSNFIAQFILSLLKEYKNNLALFLCDFKKVELADYKNLKQVAMADSQEELKKVTEMLIQEMKDRYTLFLEVPKGQRTFKSLAAYNAANPTNQMAYALLLIDEFADVEDPAIWEDIKTLLREGRGAGILIALATQIATKEAGLQPAIKRLITTYISFGVGNDSHLSGTKGSEDLKIGEFIINSEEFSNQRILAAYVGEKDKTYTEVLKKYEKEI